MRTTDGAVDHDDSNRARRSHVGASRSTNPQPGRLFFNDEAFQVVCLGFLIATHDAAYSFLREFRVGNPRILVLLGAYETGRPKLINYTKLET